MNGWKWTRTKERAALLVADGSKTDAEIAAELGIAERTLGYWKADGEFQGRIQAHLKAFRNAIRRHGIASVDARVQALQNRWERMQQVIDERAVDSAMQHAAGGSTGLLTRKVVLVKVYEAGSADDPEAGGADDEPDGTLASAKRYVEVEEFAVDTGLLRELREHEKQAAQELGQWLERKELEVNASAGLGESLARRLAGLIEAGEAGADGAEPAGPGDSGPGPE